MTPKFFNKLVVAELGVLVLVVYLKLKSEAAFYLLTSFMA